MGYGFWGVVWGRSGDGGSRAGRRDELSTKPQSPGDCTGMQGGLRLEGQGS